jgi:CheY-like chemotaxis protein
MSQKVLVVEDDNNIAELLRLYLQKDGFEVSHAADGGKAVEMAKEIQPDLVLLDIMLPVMDGWQVCRELRKTMKMPIIMLTAKGETEDKVSGLEMGADDYIVKPFEVKELLARVHAVLRRTGDDGKPKSKKLTFDKLVINLDSYELIVDGRSTRRPRRWSCCTTSRRRPTASTPATSCSTRCGALTTSATAAPSTCTLSACARSSRACPTSGRSRPSGAWAISSKRKRRK